MSVSKEHPVSNVVIVSDSNAENRYTQNRWSSTVSLPPAPQLPRLAMDNAPANVSLNIANCEMGQPAPMLNDFLWAGDGI